MRFRFPQPIRAWFAQGLTPHQLALAIAAGGTCAFFPVLGAATPLCVATALALRLNQPLVQGVNALTAPVYPAMVFLFVRVGEALTGAPAGGLDFSAWAEIVRRHPAEFLGKFGATVAHAVVGWGVLSAFGAPCAYLATRLVLRWAALAQQRRRPQLDLGRAS